MCNILSTSSIDDVFKVYFDNTINIFVLYKQNVANMHFKCHIWVLD